MSTDDERPAKRVKTSIEDDLICPITLELPFDPVTAEDGRVYERKAIEKHIENNPQLKSPVTNEPIGRRLFPAPQHKNIIEASVENGTIGGDLATNWKQKLKMKEKFEGWLEKAEKGDTAAMLCLSCEYYNGMPDVSQPKDHKKAFEWAERAHNAGSATGTGFMGVYMAYGFGCEKDRARGMMYLGVASGKGDCFANYFLGRAHMKGLFGLPINLLEAKRHLEAAVEAKEDRFSSRSIHLAKEFLDELLSSSGLDTPAATPSP